jgi:hypothetical protein
MRARRQAATDLPPEQTAASLTKSLESTRRGLALFLESLERSGLPEAVPAYHQLYLVLLHQRLWARAHRRRELDGLFDSVRATAGAIHSRLTALAAVMEQVRRLDEPPLAVAVNDRGGPAAALLEGLLARVSVSLVSAERQAGPEGRTALERLVEAGLLETRGRGRGRSYRLSPVACRGLALWLCEPLKQRHATPGAP